jgi:hypothetical protein
MLALPCRLRHAATVLALAIPCHGALAGTSEWHFVYTGFEVTSEDQLGIETTAYDPAAHIDGRFSGTDVNANGVLEKEELSTLIVQGNYYQPCGGPYQTCTINAFSFGPGGVLSFKLEHHSSDPEGYFFFNVWVESGKRMHISFTVSGRDSVITT